VSDLGVAIPGGTTPRQLASLLATHLPEQDDADVALDRARSTVERSRYSRAGAEPSGSGVDGSSMLDDVTTVVRRIAAGRSRRERLRARLLPPSGRDRIRRWAERRGRQMARVDLGAARGVRLLLPRRRRA
jgi:hypothetical protein